MVSDGELDVLLDMLNFGRHQVVFDFPYSFSDRASKLLIYYELWPGGAVRSKETRRLPRPC